jgi:hypothetical protein
MSRLGLTAGGDFRRVTPTLAEMNGWQAQHPRRPQPSVYRVECLSCGKRIWGSGIAIGAHRKACPGDPADSLGPRAITPR